MSLQPTRTQVRTMQTALRAGTAYPRDATILSDIQTEISGSSLAAVAALINVNDSTLTRYVGSDPHRADVLVTELMWLSYQELNP